MAIMLSSLYDALVEGGTSKENARKAAEEVASFDTRMHRIESTMRLHTWMLGIIIAGVISLVTKSFS